MKGEHALRGTLPSRSHIRFSLRQAPALDGRGAGLCYPPPSCWPPWRNYPSSWGENGGWPEARGDPYHAPVNDNTSTSMPDILYPLLEMSQLTPACAHSLRQLPWPCHPTQRPAPSTTASLLHAQPLSCPNTQPSRPFSQCYLKWCREIFPAPPDRKQTWMFLWPVLPRGHQSTNDQQMNDDVRVRVPGKGWAARKGQQNPGQPSSVLCVRPHWQMNPAVSHLQHKEHNNQCIQVWLL